MAVSWPILGRGQLQSLLTQPWSYSVNYTFGRGTVNPGPPMTGATSDLTYTTNSCPMPGEYAVSNQTDCPGLPVPLMKTGGYEIGGTFYYGYALTDFQQPGYMMLASYSPSSSPRILFSKTVTGLCGNRDYLFWAAIRNLVQSSCLIPSLTFQVETLSGTVIQSFPTGQLGQGGSTDSAKYYIGFYNPIGYPPVPFYGGTFTLPAGVNDIVLKIIIDPSNAFPDCRAGLAIDNIELTPMGPAVEIGVPGNPNAYQAGACFQGNVPLVLDGQLLDGYAKFGTPDTIPATFVNPAVQWQESLDQGYTWQDIPGETKLNISHVFNAPDTFYVRLRAAPAADIGNLYCNVVSNLIRVDVDSLPIGSVTSNSPVCEDSDIVFNLQGGASYLMTGPNGFFSNDAKAHIYHPSLADSGWYYTQIVSFGGCISEDSVHVVVHGPAVTVSGDETICYGQEVQLQATGGSAYAWSPPAGLSNAGVATPLASPTVTTKYQVKVTDQSGCSAFAAVGVNLRDSLLRAAFSAPVVACPRDLVSFADSSRGMLVRWAWDFGNGQSSPNSVPPGQVYPSDSDPVDYTVRLIVTDTAGCADTAVRIVKSVNNCYIAVPSAFTPNGDGHNDYLYPLNAWKATDLVFRVYNRNGELVFETRDWTKKWDGRVNGRLQPPGVFVWALDYTDAANRRQSQKGTTILIR